MPRLETRPNCQLTKRTSRPATGPSEACEASEPVLPTDGAEPAANERSTRPGKRGPSALSELGWEPTARYRTNFGPTASQPAMDGDAATP